jgi:hypothetical protein
MRLVTREASGRKRLRGQLARASFAALTLAVLAGTGAQATSPQVVISVIQSAPPTPAFIEGTFTPYIGIAVATFTDDLSCSSPCTAGDPYPGVVKVTWGDNTGPDKTNDASPNIHAMLTSSNGTQGTYALTGDHNFPDEFSSFTGVPPLGFTITVSVTPTNPGGITFTNQGYIAVSDQPRKKGLAATPLAEIASVPFTGAIIGHFNDGNFLAAATDHGGTTPEYGISINWGDGTPVDTSSGNVLVGTCDSVSGPNAQPGCAVDVTGDHKYAYGGTYPISIQVTDGLNGFITTLNATSATVHQNITATVINDVTPTDHVEGVSYTSIPMATFADDDACPTTCQPTTDYNIDINWGDGTHTAPSSITQNAPSGTTGNYSITGDHVYAQDGTYAIAVTVDDSNDSVSTVGNGTIAVGEQAISANPTYVFSGTAGTGFTKTIGTFHDNNQLATTLDNGSPEYAVKINWGDGTPLDTTNGHAAVGFCGASPGPAPQGCTVTVTGSHKYTVSGNYGVTITIGDGANPNALQFTSMAHVVAVRGSVASSGAAGSHGRNIAPSPPGSPGPRTIAFHHGLRLFGAPLSPSPRDFVDAPVYRFPSAI